MNSRLDKFFFPFLWLAVFSLFGIGLLMWITQLRGIGLTPDSVSYIAGARSLIQGQGLWSIPEGTQPSPFTGFGPVYSIFLAGFSVLWGKDPLQSAPLFQAIVLSLNVFIPACLLFRLTNSFKAAWATAFFLLTSIIVLEIHALAMSEGLFMALNICGLYLLSRYLQDQKRGLFIASIIICSLAFLSRYAGASIAAMGPLALLLWSRKPWRARILEAFIFGFFVSLPMALWITRNYLIAEVAGWFVYKPKFFLTLNLWELFAHLSLWFLPAGHSSKLRFILLILFLIFALWLILRTRFLTSASDVWPEKWQGARLFASILALFSISHISVHLLSSYVVAHIILDNRHLAPVYIAVVTGLALLMTKLLAEESLRKSERWVALGFIFFLAALHLPRLYFWSSETRQNGLGYGTFEWQNSEILQKIRELPPDAPIYTNGFDAVYILTGRPAAPLPSRIARADLLPAHRVNNQISLNPEQFARMADDLKTKDGFLVYLDKIYWRKYQPTESELIPELNLETAVKASDGTIYRVKS